MSEVENDLITANALAVKEEKPHHVRGMSQWPAILACNAFVGKPPSKHTERGTDIHAKLAEWLEHFKREGLLPNKPEDLDYHEEGAWKAAEWIARIFYKDELPSDRLFVEHKCTIGDDVFGRCDAAWFNPKRGIVYVADFKAFYNPSRDYIPQLEGYGLAIAEKLPTKATGICCSVLYGDMPSKSFSKHMNIACAERTYLRTMTAFDTRDRGESSPTQCGWCDLCANQSTCPACRAVVEQTMSKAAEVIAAWESYPVEKKAQALVLAETVAKWADEVRGKAKADLMAGLPVIEDAENGIRFGLRTTSGRKTPRTLDAYNMLLECGVDKVKIKDEFTLSLASCKKLLGGAGIKGKTADAMLEEVCDKTAGSVSMVRL